MVKESCISQEHGLGYILEFAKERLGVDLYEEKRKRLVERLLGVAKKQFQGDPSRLVKWFLCEADDGERVAFLSEHVTVSETYFFRDFGVFTAFRYYVLPELLEEKKALERKELRIWCAGCSTGEEAYSLAMMFDQAFKNGLMDRNLWIVRIKGTDVNPDRISQARKGVYYPWSFRGTMPPHYLSYFSVKEGNARIISPEIREMVKFDVLNLMDPVYPSSETETENLDCIFCRNVFLYMRKDAIREILHRFYMCLSAYGWLVVAASELHFADRTMWDRVMLPGATYLRKKPPSSRITLSGRISSPCN